jgi:predicted dehydrogenase
VTASGSTLRVGFIGAGFSARLHVEAYHQVRGVDVALTRVVEKPLTGCFAPASTPRAEMLHRALASGDEIIVACREAGVRLCYAENWVYAPPIQRARRLLTAAGGPILRIVGKESHGGTHAPVVGF